MVQRGKLGVRLGVRLVGEQQRIGVHVPLHLFALDILGALLVVVVVDKVHLGHDIDMRDVEIDHGAHRAQHARKVLWLVVHKVRVEQVGGAYPKVELLLHQLHKPRHDRVVRIQLNLAGAVNDQVVVVVVSQLVLEPVEIVEQVTGLAQKPTQSSKSGRRSGRDPSLPSHPRAK